jgi:hypothetical protein
MPVTFSVSWISIPSINSPCGQGGEMANPKSDWFAYENRLIIYQYPSSPPALAKLHGWTFVICRDPLTGKWRALVSEGGDFDRVCPNEWGYVPSYDEVLTTYWQMNISIFPYLHLRESTYFRPEEDGK